VQRYKIRDFVNLGRKGGSLCFLTGVVGVAIIITVTSTVPLKKE